MTANQKMQTTTDLKNLKSLTVLNWIDCEIKCVQIPEYASPENLAFANDEKYLATALKNRVGCVIVLEKMKPILEKFDISQTCVFTTPQMAWAMTEVLALFDAHPKREKSFTHPTAVVSPHATIGKDVHIGAFSVIEDFCKIEDNAVIENHVYLGAFSEIGPRTIIHPFTTIGKSGFGFYTNKDFQHTRIPQIGRVVIESDCEIGAHCAIDRAAILETRIKRGTKFDNFCHVAHNCEIGENSIITAGFIVAGSTKIGKNFMSAGGVHVNAHISVADNVVCAGRTGIASDLTESGTYGGYPAIPIKESLRVMSSLIFLPKIRKQLAQISKHLGLEFSEK
jgi:UDP-3-O-[3-hydroxymyristoyl] glucosamine N-acyltransferase